MTEAEWLTATDPTPMLQFLKGVASDRKLRLFTCSCVRRIWHLLDDERGREAIGFAEKCADGILSLDEAYGACQQLQVFEPWELAEQMSQATGIDWEAYSLAIFAAGMAAGWLDTSQADKTAENVASAVGCQAVGNKFNVQETYDNAALPYKAAERSAQTPILREIFGNPFRPVAVDPTWLTSTAVAVAQGLYDDKAFDRLPILADALQDAGCENADLLTHLPPRRRTARPRLLGAGLGVGQAVSVVVTRFSPRRGDSP